MKKKRASIRGVLTRELLRLAISTQKLRNGGIFIVAAKLAGRKSTWTCPKDCTVRKVNCYGASAGVNLALALTLTLRENGLETPNALVLMSPWADMTGSGLSRTLNYKKDPMFGKRAGDEGANDKRKPGNPYAKNANLYDIHLSPVYAEFTGFPPMLIQVGEWEMLFDDARSVMDNACKAGVDATLMVYPGMFHVFQAYTFLPESKVAWKEVGAFIKIRFAV